MIVEKMLPRVYYEESRDFSYIGRLFEIALNYIKTGAEIIAAPLNTENISSLLVDLLTTTLGFESNPNYLTRDLVDIDSVFISALRQKGSILSISLVILTLLSSQEIMSQFAVEYTTKVIGELTIVDYNSIDIFLPTHTVDIMLLERILDYILPAGTIYRIRPAATSAKPFGNKLEINGKVLAFKSGSSATVYGVPDSYVGKVYESETDISEGPMPKDTTYDIDNDHSKRSLTSFGVVATDNPS